MNYSEARRADAWVWIRRPWRWARYWDFRHFLCTRAGRLCHLVQSFAQTQDFHPAGFNRSTSWFAASQPSAFSEYFFPEILPWISWQAPHSDCWGRHLVSMCYRFWAPSAGHSSSGASPSGVVAANQFCRWSFGVVFWPIPQARSRKLVFDMPACRPFWVGLGSPVLLDT